MAALRGVCVVQVLERKILSLAPPVYSAHFTLGTISQPPLPHHATRLISAYPLTPPTTNFQLLTLSSK